MNTSVSIVVRPLGGTVAKNGLNHFVVKLANTFI